MTNPCTNHVTREELRRILATVRTTITYKDNIEPLGITFAFDVPTPPTPTPEPERPTLAAWSLAASYLRGTGMERCAETCERLASGDLVAVPAKDGIDVWTASERDDWRELCGKRGDELDRLRGELDTKTHVLYEARMELVVWQATFPWSNLAAQTTAFLSRTERKS